MATTSDRWQQIEQLYHAARERNAGERAAFLAEACAEDASLLQAIESLIAASEESSGFLDQNALALGRQPSPRHPPSVP